MSPTHRSIVVLGEAGVGKTCFLDMFVNGHHFIRHDGNWMFPSPGFASTQRQLTIDSNPYLITMLDLSLTPMRTQEEGFRSDIFEKQLLDSHGVVFLYDVTDKRSYDLITEHAYTLTYLSRRSETYAGKPWPSGRQRFGCVLVGNKADITAKHPEKREVSKGKAGEWASMHGWKSYEVSCYVREELEEVVRGLVESSKKAERRDAEDLQISVEERWREVEGWDMWGKRIEPWGEFEGVGGKEGGEKVERKIEGKKDKKKDKKGLGVSFSKLRDALPRIRVKNKAPTQ
ncbi:P-loop containing nucleoside triphosphate hydrolase protein [Lentithecium fluviatile CBS 122367]|uniref:P-loop containing nucleoside triphosphate hydrolase protein n=1 Tax=Lentithecium fluviatile CBS 122367 TaxID=1168545 RepID=A0A6G1J6Y5_9PLEO|nr:P-loop containing nucleoside triphosphate hydrolase protein [Lentithecium fluviatile CBS 122367]